MVDAHPHDSRERWARTMETQMQAQRDELRQRDPERVAQHAGARWTPQSHDAGHLSLTLLQHPYIIRVPEYAVLTSEGGTAPTMSQALLTAYLLTADGTPRAGEWIAFRELPDGVFYHQAFTGYTGGLLARTLGNDIEAFQRGASAAGGGALSALGDAAYEFRVLPRLWMAVVYWLGDDEDGFPPQANVLFDRAASHYLIADGLAILGSQLTRQILAGAAA